MKKEKIGVLLPLAAGLALTGTGFGAWVFSENVSAASAGDTIKVTPAINLTDLTVDMVDDEITLDQGHDADMHIGFRFGIKANGVTGLMKTVNKTAANQTEVTYQTNQDYNLDINKEYVITYGFKYDVILSGGASTYLTDPDQVTVTNAQMIYYYDETNGWTLSDPDMSNLKEVNFDWKEGKATHITNETYHKTHGDTEKPESLAEYEQMINALKTDETKIVVSVTDFAASGVICRPRTNNLYKIDFNTKLDAFDSKSLYEKEQESKAIYFGKTSDYASQIASLTAVAVDDLHAGTINAYYDDATKNMYILSNGTISFDDDHVPEITEGGETYPVGMFQYVSSAETISLDNIKCTLTDLDEFFAYCSSLKNIEINDFDTSTVTSTFALYNGCSSLTSIDLTWLNKAPLTNTDWMFGNCNNLTSIDLTPLNTANVTSMRYMFNNCKTLTSLDLSVLNTGKVQDMSHTFFGCSNMTSYNFGDEFDATKVENFEYCFMMNTALTALDLTHLKTSEAATNMSYMFCADTALTSITFPEDFDTSNVEYFRYMFSRDSALTSLDLSHFDTSAGKDFTGMFQEMTSITALNLYTFNTSNATCFDYMFSGSSNLVTIGVNSSTFVVPSSLESSFQMFFECSKLTGANGTTYDYFSIDANMAHVDTASNPGYFTEATSATQI